MLSEKFSIAAAVRWIHSDLTYDYTEETTPGNAFAADIAAYYQNYINIGQRECQLGIGLNVSNIGSKITFGGDDNSEFILRIFVWEHPSWYLLMNIINSR